MKINRLEREVYNELDTRYVYLDVVEWISVVQMISVGMFQVHSVYDENLFRLVKLFQLVRFQYEFAHPDF